MLSWCREILQGFLLGAVARHNHHLRATGPGDAPNLSHEFDGVAVAAGGRHVDAVNQKM